MATQWTYATMSVAAFASGCWESTPRNHKPGYRVGCWGPEASEFAKETLLGQRVAFATDPTQSMYDRYGRTLAYLDKADGWDYSVEAARAVRRTPTSTTTSRPVVIPRSRRRSKRRRMRSVVFGGRRVTATPHPFPFRNQQIEASLFDARVRGRHTGLTSARHPPWDGGALPRGVGTVLPVRCVPPPHPLNDLRHRSWARSAAWCTDVPNTYPARFLTC